MNPCPFAKGIAAVRLFSPVPKCEGPGAPGGRAKTGNSRSFTPLRFVLDDKVMSERAFESAAMRKEHAAGAEARIHFAAAFWHG